MEAITSFGTSTLSLAMALPMCLVDLLCYLVLSVAGLLTMVLAPVVDFLGEAGMMAVAATGMEESWSTNHTLFAIYALYAGFGMCGRISGLSFQQTFSKYTNLAIGLLWIATFLSFPDFETATHARVGLVALALQAGSISVRALFLEFSGYRHAAAPTSLDAIATGYLGCLGMEATAALCICAFGYPGLSAEDAVSRYYCLVPLMAMQIIYFTSVHKVEEAVEEVTANGHVTEVKEGLDAKIEEVKEVCGEKVTEVKEKIEAAVEKVLEDPAVVEAAANVEAVGQIVEDKVEEIVEAVKEKVEEVDNAVEEKVEEVANAVEAKVEEVKAEPWFQKLLALLTTIYTSIASRAMLLLSPLLALASALTARLAAVPWASLLLLSSTTASHLLHGAAWHHLTGSSLALALPVLTLALPAALDYLAPRLPITLPPYIKEGAGLAVAATTYLLTTSEVAGGQ